MWFIVMSAVLLVIAVAWSVEPFMPGNKKDDAQMRLPLMDQAMVADLAVAAVSSGCSIPALLTSLDSALSEEEEESCLKYAAKSLAMGGTWQEAWQDVPSRFRPLRDALEPAWVDGAAATPLLERTAAGLRAARVRRARESAAKLGAKLVLPLGLCFLPAFILLGVVPIVVSAGIAILK